MDNYPKWKSWLWRLIRGAVATALGQTVILACGAETFNLIACYTNVVTKWGNLETAMVMISASFASGFLMALGLAVRDLVSGGDKSARIQKLPL